MKTRFATESSLSTLFAWDFRNQRLAGWILVACLLHALLFIFVDAGYAPPMDITPARTPVWMPVEGTPEADRIFAWAESRDPTLMAPTRLSPRGVSLPTPNLYKPSYDQDILPLVPFPIDPVRKPPPSPTFAGIELWQPAPKGETLTISAPTTKVVFESPDPRKVLQTPQIPFQASQRDHLMPATFRIGIAPDGTPIFFFLLRGSGNATLDATAEQYLRQTRFEEADSLDWTNATFLWGADLLRTNP